MTCRHDCAKQTEAARIKARHRRIVARLELIIDELRDDREFNAQAAGDALSKLGQARDRMKWGIAQ